MVRRDADHVRNILKVQSGFLFEGGCFLRLAVGELDFGDLFEFGAGGTEN